MSLIPSPHPVRHIPRRFGTTLDPDTNNPTLTDQTPVKRMVQSLTQFGRRGSSREVISSDYLLRSETELHMAVADPTLYQEHDQVVCFAEWDAVGDYVPGTGVAYWVDGVPNDERNGPWPQYLMAFGGVVKLKKVS